MLRLLQKTRKFGATTSAPFGRGNMPEKVVKPDVVKSEEDWRRQLTPEQYQVTRRKGTEPAFTGQYWNHHEDGTYSCVCCGNPLFQSDTKFDSGTGWPSFSAPITPESVGTETDTAHGNAARRGGVQQMRCASRSCLR